MSTDDEQDISGDIEMEERDKRFPVNIDGEQDNEDMEEVALMVRMSIDDRHETAVMLRELLEYRKGQPARDKNKWISAIFSHILILIIISFLIMMFYESYVLPVNRLQDWIPVSDCLVSSNQLDFQSSFLPHYPLTVFTVDYPMSAGDDANGDTQYISGYCTQSVTGTSINSDEKWLMNALTMMQLQSPTPCFVDPNNAYRVALSQDEKVSFAVISLLICLVILLLLQFIAMVQTCTSGEVKMSICSRKRSYGYSHVDSL